MDSQLLWNYADTLTVYVLAAAKWVLPVLAVWLLARCVRSMLREKYEPEIWGWLEAGDGSRAALKHWECVIGRAKSCDVVVDRASVQKTHAALLRSDAGEWRLYDLSGGGARRGRERDEGKGVPVRDGDKLIFADVSMTFHDLNAAQRSAGEKRRSMPGALVSQGLTLLILTAFQLLLLLEYTETLTGTALTNAALAFAFLAGLQWCYFLLMRAIDRRGFEVETLAFFLCTLGLAVCISAAPEELIKQLVLLLAGVLFFVLLGWWLRDLHRVKALRWPVALAALGFLALNVVLGETRNGAANWVNIGGFSLQPSEFVKVAYIYVGAASLDRLFVRRNLLGFIAFSAVCVGALALMGDFGAALIFFVTSGDLLHAFGQLRHGIPGGGRGGAGGVPGADGEALYRPALLHLGPCVGGPLRRWRAADPGPVRRRQRGHDRRGRREGLAPHHLRRRHGHRLLPAVRGAGADYRPVLRPGGGGHRVLRGALRRPGAQLLLRHSRLRHRRDADGAAGAEHLRQHRHSALYGGDLSLCVPGRQQPDCLLGAAGLYQGGGHPAERQLLGAPGRRKAAAADRALGPGGEERRG